MKILKNKYKVNNEKTTINSDIKEKNLTIEILRIIACFLVIVCHTNSWGFDRNVIDTGWVLSVAVYLISKTAVPIFFMISGALYLKKDYSYKDMFKKVFFRILVPLTLFSAVLYFKENRALTVSNFVNFFQKLLAGDILLHYWFLYALIGLYIATPFIRKMILNFEKKDYNVFFSIWIIFLGVLPIIEHYAGIRITSSFSIPLIVGYIGYYVLGYYMMNYITTTKCNLIINIIMFILSIFVSTLVTYLEYINTNNYSVFLDKLNYISIIIPTVNVIYIVRYITDRFKPKEKIKKLIVQLGATTFGIYLTHWMILGKIDKLLDFLVDSNVYQFVACAIVQLIIFAVMSIGVYIVRKIPFMKKII